MTLAWITFLSNLSLAFVSIIMGGCMLRVLDWATGVNFKKVIIPILQDNPIGAAIYYGTRFFAVIYGVSVLMARVPV